MKYYINEIHSPFVSYNQLIVGLFKSTDDVLTYITNEGVGDYVMDCIVLAYYIQNRHTGYEPKGYPHIRECVIYQYFYRLAIGSPMWTESFEADDDRTAIDKFFQEQFDTRFQSVKPEDQRMTKEEARKTLLEISYALGNMGVEYLSEKDGEKMREAIKALEQQPIDKSDMMYEIYMEGVNMTGEYQGCWVRFKDIEKIVDKYMKESEK